VTQRSNPPGGGLLPDDDALRQAVRWIAGERQAQPDRKLHELLAEASTRFDLSPRQEQALYQLLTA
jgi:hypothetical protein